MGAERVNTALRRMIEKHSSGEPPLATTLDLYRELQAVTPDSLQYLLHGLFDVNTFWELEADRVEQTITVTVPREPVLAGIDPYHLLDWVEGDDDDSIEVVRLRS